MTWHDMIWYMMRYDMRYGIIWYYIDMIWYEMIWYDVMWCNVMWCDVTWRDLMTIVVPPVKTIFCASCDEKGTPGLFVCFLRARRILIKPWVYVMWSIWHLALWQRGFPPKLAGNNHKLSNKRHIVISKYYTSLQSQIRLLGRHDI